MTVTMGPEGAKSCLSTIAFCIPISRGPPIYTLSIINEGMRPNDVFLRLLASYNKE